MFSLLGQVDVRVGARLVRVPAGKSTELLVRLALSAGEVVRTDVLLDDLWPDDPAGTQRNTLQSKVARLRRALDDPHLIETCEGGYRLAVDPTTIDAHAVAADAVAARRFHDIGDDRQACSLSATALARFSGDVLAGVGDNAWILPHRARLDDVRLSLLETNFAARLRLGLASEIVNETPAALSRYPYHEALWALHITALYQSGRQADALAAYQRIRILLADELGLEPSPPLRKLEERILRQDPALARVASEHDAGPVVVRSTPPRSNLPALDVDLIGRQRETGEILELVKARRLVEIVGPGGVGKTTLAIAAARMLVDDRDVWLVRLESAATLEDIIDATTSALGVAGGEPALIERLRAGPAVVIFDNCEHLIDDAAAWTERLLEHAPPVRVLLTSQTALDVPGSAVFHLDPLDLEQSVELFLKRANLHREPSEDERGQETVRELCRALDGLPLAIELAAARTRTLSTSEIVRRLDDRFAVLHDPTSRKPERRRALRSTIQWSYDLLFADDQRGLCAIAVFNGGAALSAVESVAASLGVPSSTAIDVVGRLVSRSLVVVDVDSNDDHRRYRLLESIKAFAFEQGRADGIAQIAQRAHAEWYADAADASTSGVRGAGQDTHLMFARRERSNIDTALSWCRVNDPTMALRIAIGFGWAWIVLGDTRGAERIETALVSAGVLATPGQRAEALLLIGWIEASTGHLQPARSRVDEATAIARLLDDPALEAKCAYYLAYIVSHDGEFELGLELTERAAVLMDELDLPWDKAANGLFAARAATSLGDGQRATEKAEAVTAYLRVVDDPWLHVRGDAMLGELARLQRRFDDAVSHLRRTTEACRYRSYAQAEAYQTTSLGRAQCLAGDIETGVATLSRGIEKAEAIGDSRMAALARVHLGRVLRGLGRTAEARSALENAVTWQRNAGGGELALLGECLLAAMDAADGVTDGPRRVAAILGQARSRSDRPVEVFALDAAARIAASKGDADTARALLAEADDHMAHADHFISEADRVDARSARAESSKSEDT